ncbi:hypothetical protein VTO73DRAFT_8385 [Trametes versicolor]
MIHSPECLLPPMPVPPRQSAPPVDVAAVSPLNIVSECGPTSRRPGTRRARHRPRFCEVAGDCHSREW